MVAPVLRFVDLFAGIGGFHLALSSLGAKCVFSCEIDEDCQDVYEANFGKRPAGDIRPLTEGSRVKVPAHDILCAGFPCQPFSKSGFQRGMNETRGTLFFNILRILEARRPRYAILENVRNLAGPRQRRTWETIIEQLRRLGYRVSSEPAVFSPHLLPREMGGRPQVRERVFILCEHVGEDAAAADMPPLVANKPVEGWDPRRWRIEEWLQSNEEISALRSYRLRPQERRWIDAWNDFIRVIDEDPLPGFPIWVDAFRQTEEFRGPLPAWKRVWMEKNLDLYSRHRRSIDLWIERHDVLSFPPSRRKLEWQARGWVRNLWKLVLHLRPSGIRVKGPTYLPALVAITQTSIIGARRRKLTPREGARLQGFPDDFQLHSDTATAYRQLGNAVNVGAVAHVARALINEIRCADACPTVAAASRN